MHMLKLIFLERHSDLHVFTPLWLPFLSSVEASVTEVCNKSRPCLEKTHSFKPENNFRIDSTD